MTEDHELERLMRAGLERRAGDVDETAPVVTRAVGAARRRRRGRLATGSAALAVAAVAVTGVVVDRDATPGGDDSPGVTDRVSDGPLPSTWRTEYWHDLAVDVPADWGWGSAPQKDFGGGSDLIWCGGPGAILDPTGKRLHQQDVTMPYVGRPILQSDVCMTGSDETPRAPYVWLGVPIEPGSVDLGGGYVRETREVNGSTVSVATRDPALRERILDSATGGETCFSELESAPRAAESSQDAELTPESLTVCAYRDDSSSGSLALVHASVLDATHAQALLDAVEAAPQGASPCAEQPGWEYVVLRLEGSGPGGESHFREYVVDFSCNALRAPDGGGQVGLTRATVDPWAVDGIKVSLTGTYGTDGDLAGYFIGMQG